MKRVWLTALDNKWYQLFNFQSLKKTITIILFFNVLFSFGQNIKVNIFSTDKTTSAIFSPQKGNYLFIADNDTLKEITNQDILNFIIENDSVLVKGILKKYGIFKQIELIATNEYNHFRVKPVSPPKEARSYDDNLLVWANDGKLILVNDAYLENYVAGVVQSESGTKSTLEYYKTQAILCRTFALKTWNKFYGQGYNLCDNVNCQVYFGKATKNYEIIEAAYATKDLVIIDSTKNLISATFFSNCGGETANSEDVWLQKISYLRSVPDSFCTHSHNANWVKTISKSKWQKYLIRHGFQLPSKVNFSFTQNHRKKYYRIGNDSIRTTDIRYDWHLKSAFFDIVTRDGNLIFNGRGYGHGVGLCQEGAMEMSKKKFNYEEILHFYYVGIRIVNLFTLPKENLPISMNEN